MLDTCRPLGLPRSEGRSTRHLVTVGAERRVVDLMRLQEETIGPLALQEVLLKRLARFSDEEAALAIPRGPRAGRRGWSNRSGQPKMEQPQELPEMETEVLVKETEVLEMETEVLVKELVSWDEVGRVGRWLDLAGLSPLFGVFPQTVWTHLGVLTVIEKQLCLDRCATRACAANSPLFTVHSYLSKSSTCISTAQLTKSARRRRVLLATPLSLWCRAHFRTWWSLFVAGARETSCFRGPKSTFRDRCKGSELLYFEMQFSWQAQCFGHGGDLRRALIS